MTSAIISKYFFSEQDATLKLSKMFTELHAKYSFKKKKITTKLPFVKINLFSH